MKFLADESIERRVLVALRQEGYDASAIEEDSPGVDDEKVLGEAESQRRVLLTNDKDFAELAFLQRKAKRGIVLLRLGRFRSARKAARLLEVVRQEGNRLRGAMTVVEPHAIRRRAFPS